MRFIKSSILVSLGTLSSRLLGFVRDLLIARFLGAGINSDVFFIGLKIPNTIRQIFGEGAFNVAFIPLIKKYSDKNKISEKGLKFIEETFVMFMSVIIISMILLEIFMPEIIGFLAPTLSERGSEIHDLAVMVGRIITPYILFVSYMTFSGAVLNSVGKFAAMAFAPALVNLGYIMAFAYVYLFNIKVTQISYVPSFGMVFGGFMQFLMMYISLKKMPFKIKIVKPTISKEVKILFKRFIPTIFGTGIVILNSLVSVFLASSLEKGSVSYLFYTDRLVQLPTALFGTAIATVFLPTLSEKIKNKTNISKAFNNVFLVCLILASLCTAYLFEFSDIVVNTLFERGEFTRLATEKTSAALALFACALPVIMALKSVTTVFYAKGDTKSPTIISAICFIVNFILSVILMQFYSYLGLVMASVIALYLNIVAQLLILLKNKIVELKYILSSIGYYLIFQIILILSFSFFKNIWLINLENAILVKLLYLVVSGMVGGIVMLVLIFCFNLHKKILITK